MRREVLLLVVGIAVSVTLPFAWAIARQYGGWWGGCGLRVRVLLGGRLADALLRSEKAAAAVSLPLAAVLLAWLVVIGWHQVGRPCLDADAGHNRCIRMMVSTISGSDTPHITSYQLLTPAPARE
jgi:hypothetical protein